MVAALLALLLSAAPARADLTISAELSNSAPTLNEQIVLSVSVSGPHANLPDPQVPVLSNFSIYSSGRSQNISFVNGSLSSSIVHTFVLVPHFVGTGTIPPISVAYDGKIVKTAPISVQVRPPGQGQAGSASRPGQAPKPQARGRATGPDVFVAAEVDKKKAYVNEQVTLSIKFYTATSLLGNPQYNAPKTTGFIAEDLPPERHGNVALHGRTYYFSEIKTALFPAQGGKLTIGPASVRCQVQQDLAVDPFSPDFFQRFFSQGAVSAQTKDLNSDPIVVSAEPLPQGGRPANFSGAVGRYSISAAVDRKSVKAGEAVNLSVTIAGIGNLKAIGEPKLPPLPEFRAYETVASLNLDKKEDLVRGSKVFKTVLVPRVSGTLTIPPISFSYFDPREKAYVAASTLPLELSVNPADPGQAPVAYNATEAPAPRGVTTVNEDIRYLKTKAPGTGPGRALAAFAALGVFHSTPFLVFAFTLALAQYREAQSSDAAGARFRGAAKAAAARIKDGARLADPRACAEALSGALARYLGDKLGESPSGLTWRKISELLGSRASPGTLGELKSLWDELEALRFSPAGGQAEGLAARSMDVIKKLEKELKR